MEQAVQAFTDDALGDLDAVGVAQRIASGEISAGEAIEAAIERVRKADADLNAVQYEAFDRARADARSVRAAADRPFAGVPTFIGPQRRGRYADLPRIGCVDPSPGQEDVQMR